MGKVVAKAVASKLLNLLQAMQIKAQLDKARKKISKAAAAAELQKQEEDEVRRQVAELQKQNGADPSDTESQSSGQSAKKRSKQGRKLDEKDA